MSARQAVVNFIQKGKLRACFMLLLIIHCVNIVEYYTAHMESLHLEAITFGIVLFGGVAILQAWEQIEHSAFLHSYLDKLVHTSTTIKITEKEAQKLATELEKRI